MLGDFKKSPVNGNNENKILSPGFLDAFSFDRPVTTPETIAIKIVSPIAAS